MANYQPQLGSGNYAPLPTSSSPDILGLGMYSPASIPINQAAFNNPVQVGGQLSGLYNNFLGNTTQPVSGAQATNTTAPGFAGALSNEQQLAQTYGQMAQGRGPSLAQVTANQQGAANLAGAESMLGSARGSGNPAAAQLAAQNAQAQGGQQVAQNAVAGRTQEELGALGAQGGLYGNIAGQGLQSQQAANQIGTFNTGQANQVGLANQANTSQQNTALLNSLGQQNLAQQQGQIQGQQLNANTQLGQEALQEKAYLASAQQNGSIFGSALGAGASLGVAGLL